ncbi:uncharacterized protein LOC124335776 isoform X3 [Daphnia pulicaria]|uniref:uncharacterized protein LOC124335776 isoform X3 n=1 Tax=Daphnia pulicaria TaxID=35523 RepID=UPI001EE9C84B|nr:uncharacterized protein LOC124335776 isoform X3 [Daphnia pulicaria]
MDRTRVWRRFFIFTATVILAAVGCVAYESSSEEPANGSSLCSQQMCVFLFDRLEEQSIRLHNIEDALMRTVSILASVKDQEFSAASAALKSDPLLNSLLTADAYDPVASILLRSDQITNSLESPIRGRKKRQTGREHMTPRERLAVALKWAKKSTSNDISTSTSQIPVTASSVELNAGFKLLSTNEDTRQEIVVEDVVNTSSQGSAPTVGRDFNKLSRSAIETDKDVMRTTFRGEIQTTSPQPEIKSSRLYSTSALTITEATTPTYPTTTTVNVPGTLPTTKNVNSNLAPTSADQLATKKFVKDVVGDLTGAMKCAMAQFDESNVSEPIGILSEPQATLNPDKTLTVQFELNSCKKYWISVWIRISLRNELMILRSRKNSKAKDDKHLVLQVPKECFNKTGDEYSITLPSKAKAPCTFPLARLMECKVYNVEIIPIYVSLQGQPSIVEITVPPQLAGNSTDLVSFEHTPLSNSTHMLGLQWSAQSRDCAQLMTSVNLKIYEDASDSMLRSYSVPSECIGNAYQNSFSVSFSSLEKENNICSSINWEPLDICRKYKLEVEPEYFSSFRGKSSSLEIFTSGTDLSNCCYMVTFSSGVLSSLNNDGNYNGCTWLISVEKDSTIWLTFTEFFIEGSYYSVKVYDGPYSTSPLLLDRYGSEPPKAIRSRSNKLFVQLSPQYYRRQDYGKKFTAHYITVKGTSTPYVDGCGGYIVNTGNILKPTYPPSENSSAECVWYIENTGSGNTILLTSQSKAIVPFPIIVYDDWSSEGTVIYNGSSRASIYSFSRKTLIKFPAWNSLEREREYSWNVISSQNNNCSYYLTSSSDTFYSHTDRPNNVYSSLLDCRWEISVDDYSQIRLTFVYFDTERDHDFVSIYDGSTFYSPLLLELSGKKSKPVSVTSTTNKLLVRFSTNENSYNDVFFKGFLAFYTTVPIDEKFPKTIIGSTVVADTQSSMESKQRGTTVRYLPFGTTEYWSSASTNKQTSTSTSPSTYRYWKR